MTGIIVEFSLVVLLFLGLWWRQVRSRRRHRARAAQLDFDFLREQHRSS
jgi:hypothetical protein